MSPDRPGAPATLVSSRLAVIPALELRKGRVANASDALATPEERMHAFFAAGATWAHVVDVDAALGEHNQWPRLARLMDGRLRLQFGGGVRSMTQAQQLLDLGVERVVVGTQAVHNPLWARELGHIFAGRIVLALDASGRELVAKGRSEQTGLDIVEMARSLEGAGLAAFAYTDTSGRPDLGLVAEIRLAAPKTPLQVGGRLTLSDLEALAEAGVAAALPDAQAELDLAAALQRFPGPPVRPLLQVLRAREESEPDASEEE